MLNDTIKSIRPFIGAKDYDLSRSFYRDWGFQEIIIDSSLSVFNLGSVSFYLQRAYVREWVDNTMIFMEVTDVQQYWAALTALNLPSQYPGVRIHPVKVADWGSECFVHDPSGILWHIGTFTPK